MDESPRNVERLILSFKAKLDATLKDGTTYAADSAVWYVEALLNYSYGYATALRCTFETDSVGTTVDSNGSNGYTLTQLNDVYEYLEDKATENIPDDHYIFAIDVSLAVNGGQTTFSGVTGYARPLPVFKSTDEDDPGYWYWGDALGMCGPDMGNNIGMDAADIIEGFVNATAEYDYFTNIEYEYVNFNDYPDPNFPFTDQYLGEYRLFSYADTTGPNDDFCLSPSHINYYGGQNGVIYIVKDLEPTNKEFAYCIVIPWTIVNYDIDTHSIYIFYGNPIERP